MDEADTLIAALGLRPHPEGGWYAETWRAEAPEGVRPSGSAIYFLLRSGERSRWHRIDAAEVWHHYAGAPLELLVAAPIASTAVVGDASPPVPAAPSVPAPSPVPVAYRLGVDIAAGERPQAVVPAGAWQSARSLGAWTLVGCTVAPAFELAGFELAADGRGPEAGGGAAG